MALDDFMFTSVFDGFTSVQNMHMYMHNLTSCKANMRTAVSCMGRHLVVNEKHLHDICKSIVNTEQLAKYFKKIFPYLMLPQLQTLYERIIRQVQREYIIVQIVLTVTTRIVFKFWINYEVSPRKDDMLHRS